MVRRQPRRRATRLSLLEPEEDDGDADEGATAEEDETSL
jgi:hypothetical protein